MDFYGVDMQGLLQQLLSWKINAVCKMFVGGIALGKYMNYVKTVLSCL